MGLSEKFTDIFLNNTIRWIVVIAVVILNFVAYLQNPIKYSKNAVCKGIPCKWSVYLTAFITFTIDLLIIIGLWFTIPFSSSLPSYWIVPVALIGYAYLTDTTVMLKPVESNEELNPPPSHMKPKQKRVRFHYLIILLDIIILAQFYLYATKQDLISKTAFYDFITKMFSGLGAKAIQTVVIWVGLINIILDYVVMRQSKGFYACKYDMPKSWNF